jgi:predicted nucleic acid-binding protein
VILLDTDVLIGPSEKWPAGNVGASRQRKIVVINENLLWVPFDAEAAEAYGVLAARVAPTRPAHARRRDIMIAASAYARGVPFFTRNVKDFELVRDLVDIREVR